MPAEGALPAAMKVVVPSRMPASVMVPAVQSPIGLVQFCVVNTLWMVPCTGRHTTGDGLAAARAEATPTAILSGTNDDAVPTTTIPVTKRIFANRFILSSLLSDRRTLTS